MTSNFRLYLNYAIHIGEKHLDLHNNYDFAGFEYHAANRSLVLFWNSSIEEWVPKDNPPQLVLTISEVEYLLILPRDPGYPFTEDSCLMDFTYFPSSDREENECVGSQELPNEDDDIIFKFQSQMVIRVKGERVDVVLADAASL
jgi:hypothetical protein